MTEQKFQKCCNRIRKLEKRVDALENKAKLAQITTTEGTSQVSYESLYIPKSVIDDIREEIEDYVCNKETDTAKAQGMLNALQIMNEHIKAVEE